MPLVQRSGLRQDLAKLASPEHPFAITVVTTALWSLFDDFGLFDNRTGSGEEVNDV